MTYPAASQRSSRSAMGLAVVALCCLAFVVLPSIPGVRGILAAPLVSHDPDARGNACYVLAGGGAIWERLDAAADLIHSGRVSRIFLMQNAAPGQYSFKANRSWTKTEWMADYLAWRGVAADRVLWLPQSEGFFGTLTEARAVAGNLPQQVRTLVLVSSAPHMRRSVLAFRRSLPAGVTVVPYAATGFVHSYELHWPIWTEYLKLLVYYAIG